MLMYKTRLEDVKNAALAYIKEKLDKEGLIYINKIYNEQDDEIYQVAKGATGIYGYTLTGAHYHDLSELSVITLGGIADYIFSEPLRSNTIVRVGVPTNMKFVKEGHGWYIDLPEFIAQGGTKGELAMVAGADTFLDLLTMGGSEAVVKVSMTPYEDAQIILHRSNIVSDAGGADYIAEDITGEGERTHDMWLCAVAKWVFGQYPENIYLKVESIK